MLVSALSSAPDYLQQLPLIMYLNIHLELFSIEAQKDRLYKLFIMFQLDPSRSNSSTISVLSLPDRLTVEWSNVSVMADAEHPAGGSFTFQVSVTLPGVTPAPCSR